MTEAERDRITGHKSGALSICTVEDIPDEMLLRLLDWTSNRIRRAVKSGKPIGDGSRF